MKPLVYWCRWNEAKLVLHGRDKTAVWGYLKYWKDDDRLEKFRFLLVERVLTIGEDDAIKTIYLDEMGTLIEDS